jgi:hypothetical protein
MSEYEFKDCDDEGITIALTNLSLTESNVTIHVATTSSSTPTRPRETRSAPPRPTTSSSTPTESAPTRPTTSSSTPTRPPTGVWTTSEIHLPANSSWEAREAAAISIGGLAGRRVEGEAVWPPKYKCGHYANKAWVVYRALPAQAHRRGIFESWHGTTGAAGAVQEQGELGSGTIVRGFPSLREARASWAAAQATSSILRHLYML